MCGLRPWELVRRQTFLAGLEIVCEYTYQVGFEVLSPGSDKAFLYLLVMSQDVEEIMESSTAHGVDLERWKGFFVSEGQK